MSEERIKRLGNFDSERGSIYLSLITEEVPVKASDNQIVRVTIPTYVEIRGNEGPIRIKVEDLDAFVGLMKGHSREIRRARFAAQRDLERLGVSLSGR